jgi:hypothetical protein
MAVTYKVKPASTSIAKKNIKASDVRIENGTFVDEDGNIVDRILEQLPESTETFTITISVEVDEDGSDE